MASLENALQKLRLLAGATALEPAEEVGLTGTTAPAPAVPPELAGCIYQAATPSGPLPMLKTLLTSACERNCAYCPFRAGRDFRRVSFKPEELAALSLQLYERGLIRGLFLSSSLSGGGVHTQDRLLATAELLRQRYGYRGYLHLKLMPGAEGAQIAMALRYANRVSLNLEAPNAQRLQVLAPQKRFTEELLAPLRLVESLRRADPNRPWPSLTTQFVVGAVGESDLELLTTTAYLYREVRLARAYFSGFTPVPDTPLAGQAPCPPRREARLYQAAFLLRDYGFAVEELPFDAQGQLPLEMDPKEAWAQRHLREAPVEINQAEREWLLRIPGIGVKGAERILAARRLGRLRELRELRALGIPANRAAPYILLDGKRPPRQLRLW